MKIDEQQLTKVEEKLNKQNAVFGALGATIWSCPLLFLWQFAHSYNANFGIVMLILSGGIIGLAVRLHGQGLKLKFSAIAFVVYSWTALLAFSLQIIFGTTVTWVVILFGAYATGAGIAIYVARVEVPFSEHKALTYLTSMQTHGSEKKLVNRWFIWGPVLLFAIALAYFISLFGLAVLHNHQSIELDNKQAELEFQAKQNMEIDIHPNALESRQNKEILRYAYGYYSGLLFNRAITYSNRFTRSEYKAKNLLTFLATERDDPRAKFLMAILTKGKNSQTWMKEAQLQGDSYAQIHGAREYGCYKDPDIGTEMLQRLRRSTRHDYARKEIDSILYVGITETCNELDDPKFLLEHIINYDE